MDEQQEQTEPQLQEGMCETGGRKSKTPLNTGSADFPYLECGGCRHRKARRQNTREMYGKGRQGY